MSGDGHTNETRELPAGFCPSSTPHRPHVVGLPGCPFPYLCVGRDENGHIRLDDRGEVAS